MLVVEGCDTANRGHRASFLLPFEQVTPVSNPETRPRAVHLAHWRQVARRALASAAPAWTSLRSAAKANMALLPFQLEPALALTQGLACRFLIADDVGLGKTIQAGLMIAELFEREPGGRVLVITPAALKHQWRDELQQRFDLEADVLDAAAVARNSRDFPSTVNPWSVRRLVITSIDFVKRPDVMRSLETLVWDAIVFDEAHAFAGRSDRAMAARALGTRARTVIMLSATPHSGDDAAFEGLAAVGNLEHGFPLMMFRRRRNDVGIPASRRTTLLKVRLSAAELEMHEVLHEYSRLVWKQSGVAGPARLAVTVLSKRACSSAASLAHSIARRILLLAEHRADASAQIPLPIVSGPSDDEAPEMHLAAPGLADRFDERRRLELVATLAQKAAQAESKLRVLKRLVARLAEPAIVFTEYRDTLEHLTAALSPVDVTVLHGGLSHAERLAATRRFTHGNARLLLATDAASEGLNLQQRCRLVVNLELPWTPTRLEQRIGRVDRLGQRHRVHVLNLVASQTSEETVLAKLTHRAGRIHARLGNIANARVLDESRVAESVFADRDLPDRDGSQLSPSEARATVDLAHQARVETARLESIRSLLPRGVSRAPDVRPVATVVRRVNRGDDTRCLWAYRALFVSGDGQLVWESLLGLADQHSTACPRRAAAVGRLLDPCREPLLSAGRRAHELLRDALEASLRQPIDLMTRREGAIIRALQQHHARLSAGLMQRGLFDRRVERAAEAQSALVEVALGHCSARLEFLQCLSSIHTDELQLVFALARD
jgi:superfamily II DNA or RNA helicase